MNRFNSNVVVEINNRIAELDRQEFMIQMADFLSYEDKEQLRAIARERTKKKTVRQLASRRNSVSEKYGKSIWTHINA